MMSRQRKFPRLVVYWAYQRAALRLLTERATDADLRDKARIIDRERFGSLALRERDFSEDFPHPEDFLRASTFFTELVKRPALCADLWPTESHDDFAMTFRRREQRRELLLAMARLGHPFIDLWLLAAKRLGTLEARAQERTESRAEDLITDYLNFLERQRQIEATAGQTAFRELAEAARNFDLIVAVNFSNSRDLPLSALSRLFGASLARQTPVGPMSGGVNQRLVRQFRMPGYPLVLITTDVLQEGEDLHTFCSRVVHYGIAWTPSAIEQRTGRIDRIHSLTQRQLDNQPSAKPEEYLQVYYPHLAETVERLQVERVYERMNRFIRLMHRSLGGEKIKNSRVDVAHDLVLPMRDIGPITERLETAFQVKPEWLHADWPAESTNVIVSVQSARRHFAQMIKELEITFAITPDRIDDWSYIGVVYLLSEEGQPRLARPRESVESARQQALTLVLRSVNGSGHAVLRCVSPCAEVPRDDVERILSVHEKMAALGFGKVCAIENAKERLYKLTIEHDILFNPATTQAQEVCDLVRRVAIYADALEQALEIDLDRPLKDVRDDLLAEAQYA